MRNCKALICLACTSSDSILRMWLNFLNKKDSMQTKMRAEGAGRADPCKRVLNKMVLIDRDIGGHESEYYLDILLT